MIAEHNRFLFDFLWPVGHAFFGKVKSWPSREGFNHQIFEKMPSRSNIFLLGAWLLLKKVKPLQ